MLETEFIRDSDDLLSTVLDIGRLVLFPASDNPSDDAVFCDIVPDNPEAD